MTGKADIGPASVAQAGPKLSAARRRVLSAVAEAPRSGVTVAEVAVRLGGHPNGSRAHLEALCDDGLVSSAPQAPAGRGRPAFRYRVTQMGRMALEGRTGVDYRTLTRAFADHLAASGNTQTAREVGWMWARSLIEPQDASFAPETNKRLIDLLASLDFTPEVSEDDEVVLLHTCPFIEEARENPSVICGVHQGFIDGAMELLGEPGVARLQPFNGPGTCRLRLDLHPRGRTAH